MQSTSRIFHKGITRGRTSLASIHHTSSGGGHYYSKNHFQRHSVASSVPDLVSSFHTLRNEKEENHCNLNSKHYRHHSLSCTTPITITNRNYSVTTRTENATLVLALGTIAATAKAGQYALQAYEEWKAHQPEEDPNTTKTQDTQSSSANADKSSSSSSKTSSNGAKRENMFASFFNVGSKYYEGGFEDKMTRREAALILGVRESSTEKRIKEAHRKLLILNHPDTGGSTYLSGKINEAKELLLKKNRM